MHQSGLKVFTNTKADIRRFNWLLLFSRSHGRINFMQLEGSPLVVAQNQKFSGKTALPRQSILERGAEARRLTVKRKDGYSLEVFVC